MNYGSFDVSIELHQEDGSWWAESNDMPGWTALADSRGALVALCREAIDLWRPGASWYCIDTPIVVVP